MKKVTRQLGKRVIPTALSAAMVVSMLPVHTFAAKAEPRVMDVDGWVVQRQGENTSIEIQDGWITPDEDGNGVTIDYGKIMNDTGQQGWVVFDSDEEYYKNSSLEYDVTFTDPGDADWFATVFAPRVTDGKNYEGFSVTRDTGMEQSGRKDGAESWSGINNLLGEKFEYNKTYHMRIDTVDNQITAYLEKDGKDEMLTTFSSPIGLEESTYGFRIWRGGKKIVLDNIERKEIVKSGLENDMAEVAVEDWGKKDISVSAKFGLEDSIKSVSNGETVLKEGTDYTVTEDALIIKKEYIAAQKENFRLQVEFDKGSKNTLWVVKKTYATVQEYVWTPEKGIDEWSKISGNGTFTMGKGFNDEPGLVMKGQNFLWNKNAPIAPNGEIEITCQFLDDAQSCVMGGLFRVDAENGKWQSVGTNRDFNATAYWDYTNSDGVSQQLVWDGALWVSRLGVKDHKIKVRCENDSMSIWLDDQFTHTASVAQAKEVLGGMGIQTAATGNVLVKEVVFRSVVPFEETKTADNDQTIKNDGLSVCMAADFPRVLEYTLNDKHMDGAPKAYNYVTINTVDYPAKATFEKADNGKAITYHVTPDGIDVTFDVVFTVLDDQILEMKIKNIDESKVQVNSITLPRQPLISANSKDSAASLDAAWSDKNNWGIRDIHENIKSKNISTTADRTVNTPIITNGELSAAMVNNVYIDGDEFAYRAFELEDGSVSAGFWNTDFMYRGLDDEKVLPFAAEPEEDDLYCRVAITEDTNEDDVIDWQDGANALRDKLVYDLIPGGDQAARSFFHVGYNFASGVQQPFLKVADNMKRLSNLMDGFGQSLIFKGYANEGHDSGHADYEDINHRAGDAEDMNVAIAEADKINSNFGIHINAHEAYPEAKMFNDHLISNRNAWYWMDQSRNIRRDIDMLENSFDDRLGKLFKQTPDLDFVYVDCWEGDRWDELQLIGNMMDGGAEYFATENATDLQRFGVWVHANGNDPHSIHHYVYGSQKDIYSSSPIYWGGANHAASMMSWQHNNNINTMAAQFYTCQLPQRYLMCHNLLKQGDGFANFSDNITSSNWVIQKDGKKLTDGQNKIFIPWYAEDSKTKNPDEAAKIYHWNGNGGETTWELPNSWNNLKSVYLYQNTQTGKKLIDTIDVVDGKVTIHAKANTPYVVYPGEAEEDVTEWTVGSPMKDSYFNSRDNSIWKQSGDAEIAYNDDGNGVSILTMKGTEEGAVSQTMEGLTPGQKYRVLVYAGAENGKTARLTVKDGEKTYSNYVDKIAMNCQYFDNYALGKPVQLMWVDFTAENTKATVTLSADACTNAAGKATFMESRIVKTAEPDREKGVVAKETFEYVEQGAYGIFHPERAADGVPHLSETHRPYTGNDTINGDWSLKMNGRAGQVNVRTNPSTMRLMPNSVYYMTFESIGNGTVEVVSESDSSNSCLKESISTGHNEYTFTTGDKADYVVRISTGGVLDDFIVYSAMDETPPTVPQNLKAEAVAGTNGIKLTWDEAKDEDGRISSYNVYRDGKLLANVGNTLTYTDIATEDNTNYTYHVSAVNGGGTEGEKSEAVTVTSGVLPPAAVKAKLKNATTVTVTFNKAMDKQTAELTGNYQISGANAKVTKAELAENGRTVTLTMEGLSPMDTAVLTVKNVKDASGKNTVSGKDTFKFSMMYHYFKFDEAEDADAVDETGNQNGTKTSNVSTGEGKDGQAAQFNGNDFVSVESDALYQQDVFTVSAWINWNGLPGVNAIVGNDISGDASSRGIIFFVNSDGELRTNSNVCAVGSGDIKVTPNEWHHVAFVKNVGSAQLYLDGKKVADSPVQYGVETRVPFRIGGSSKSGGGLSYPFHGLIDEVKIFTAALNSEEEIQEAMKLPSETVVESDKTMLEALIGYADSQKENEDYANVIPVVKAAFEKALADAVAVYENTAATQEEVDAAYDKLLDMVHMLDFIKGDTTDLRALVDVVKGMNKDLFTKDSWAAVEEALANAEAVLADENAMQEEIDAVTKALQDAKDALVRIPVDKAKLQKLVDKSKKYEDAIKDYTPATAEIFEGALANAREVLANEDVTQAQIDEAYAMLQNAIFGLRLTPNKDKLEDLIKVAEEVDLADYTAESATAFKVALDNAKAVFADENATKEDVKAAEKALKAAQKALVAKADADKKDTDKKGNDKVASAGENNKPTDKAAKTGDAATALPAAMAGVAALAVFMAFKKRR